MRAVDASARLNEADKQQLHKQAFDQAEKFEVLDKRDVAALSRVSLTIPSDICLKLTTHLGTPSTR